MGIIARLDGSSIRSSRHLRRILAAVLADVFDNRTRVVDGPRDIRLRAIAGEYRILVTGFAEPVALVIELAREIGLAEAYAALHRAKESLSQSQQDGPDDDDDEDDDDDDDDPDPADDGGPRIEFKVSTN